MAAHRGLKLVRSRRRKAGVGDYGKYGLTDVNGQPLLGIANDGLTASASEIESYLRADALGTWRESAAVTPARSEPKPEAVPSADPQTGAASKREPRSASKLRAGRLSETELPEQVAPEPVELSKPPERKPAAAPVAPPVPEPKLSLRPAKPGDAAALARLISQLNGIALDVAGAQRNLAALRKAGAGLVIADLGDPVGCCGWAVVATVHRGLVGRVSMLVVDQRHRRRGIATQLLAAAEQALAAKGCALIEVMSDIEFDNAHNFFRASGFDQASYRFVRAISARP